MVQATFSALSMQKKIGILPDIEQKCTFFLLFHTKSSDLWFCNLLKSLKVIIEMKCWNKNMGRLFGTADS